MMADIDKTTNKQGTTIKYELILFFERFRFQPKVACAKLKALGYSERTIYRYYQHWREADNAVGVIQKSL